MGSVKIIGKSEYKRAVWKNGLGYTDEIAIYPEGAELKKGNFQWRLSSARIEQPSPFSVFPEHDRVLVVLEGKGIHLTHSFDGDEEEVDVAPLAPYEFPGDIQSRCELHSGPITDLSVFIRKAEVESLVTIADVSAEWAYDWIPEGRWNFAFSVDAALKVVSPGHPDPLTAEPGDAIRLDLDEPLPEGQAIRISTAAKLGKIVIVSLQG